MNIYEPLTAYGEFPSGQEQPAQPQQGTSSKKKPFTPQNVLGAELSPYLLMHAKSPAGWQTWSSLAFELARREDRPLFVSIGYYSEHWCRVMARDCFNDPEVAGMLNDLCIPVCVDREEHPDINDLFMEVCRIQNGSAGWPLNVFLTPDGRPFFSTTWLPKRTTGQMPGITELLPRMKWLWTVQRDDVEREAESLTAKMRERLDTLSGSRFRGGRIGRLKTFEALDDLRSIFDVQWGGFGGAPKFPECVKLLFLLKQAEENSGASKRDKSDALTMTDITLRRMWRGGIHDQLGGGFSRYAIDGHWIVPHFEKLLCEQALMLLTASLAQRLEPNSFHRMLAEDIIFCAAGYFADDGSYSQGFRSSICGDTSDGEGRYYLWTYDEVKRAIPEEDSGLFCAAYAVMPGGNFGGELGGSPLGQNILYEASTVTDLAKRYTVKASEVGSRLAECRKLLLDFRSKRYPLIADTKVILSWNALMTGALAHAAVSFEQSEWRDIAERTALFLQKSFVSKQGKYQRRWISGKSEIPALAEDYAYFLWAVVELYKAVKHFSPDSSKQLAEWLSSAQAIADAMISDCWDEKRGGLILTHNDPNIFMRLKSAEDSNSLPNPNAIAAIALSDLAEISEDKKYSDLSRKIIECFSHYARENPLSCLTLIIADNAWKPVKKKPAPLPAPVLTDEQLNAEPEAPQAPQEEQETERKRAPSRRGRTAPAEHAEQSTARRRRTARGARGRET